MFQACYFYDQLNSQNMKNSAQLQNYFKTSDQRPMHRGQGQGHDFFPRAVFEIDIKHFISTAAILYCLKKPKP